MSGTLAHLGAASAAIAAGSVVEAILGFGCNLVWMAFFPLFTTIQESVGVHQPLGLGLNVLILCKTYKHATPNELKPLGFTVPCGILFGLWVVTSWPVRVINALLGIFLLMYTILGRNNSNDDKKKSDEELKIEKEEGSLHATSCKENKEISMSTPVIQQDAQIECSNVATKEEDDEYYDESDNVCNDTDAEAQIITRPLAQSTDARKALDMDPVAAIAF